MVSTSYNGSCPVASCPPPYEFSPYSSDCFCAAPLIVEYRLKSPGISAFPSYIDSFETYLSNGLDVLLKQLYIDTYYWEEGPRLRMLLKLYPIYNAQNQTQHVFNDTEFLRLTGMFTGWLIPDSDIFGPYELLGFQILDPYRACKSQKTFILTCLSVG